MQRSNDIQKKIKELTKDIKRADADELANLYHQRGTLYRQAGENSKALEDHKKEIRHTELLSRNDTKGMAIAYHQLITTCLDLHDGDQALQHVVKYSDAANKCGSMMELLKSFLLIGRAYLETGEKIVDHRYFYVKSQRARRLKLYEQAEVQFNKAREFLQKFDMSVSNDWAATKCGIYLSYGILKYRQEQFTVAKEWLEKAVVEGNHSNLQDYLFRCHHFLGDVYLSTKSYKAVIIHQKKAFRIAEKLGEPARQMDAKMAEAKAHFMENQSLNVSSNSFIDLNSVQMLVSSMKKGLKALRCAYQVLIKAEQDNYFVQFPEERYIQSGIKPEILTKSKAAMFIMENFNRLSDPNSDFKIGEKKEIYEKLGDNYCTIENSSMAIECYLVAIHFAETLGRRISQRSKAALYASVALTYDDIGEFDKAIEFYQKELGCRTTDQVNSNSNNNIKEAFKTRTQIACCKYRSREIAHATTYTIEEIIVEHQNNVAKSLETNYLAARLDALNNLIFCYEFYERMDANENVIEEKRKWLESINMTEDSVRAASADAATPAPSINDSNANDFFDLLLDSNTLSDEESDCEEGEVVGINSQGQAEETNSQSEFKVPQVPGPSELKRRAASASPTPGTIPSTSLSETLLLVNDSSEFPVTATATRADNENGVPVIVSTSTIPASEFNTANANGESVIVDESNGMDESGYEFDEYDDNDNEGEQGGEGNEADDLVSGIKRPRLDHGNGNGPSTLATAAGVVPAPAPAARTIRSLTRTASDEESVISTTTRPNNNGYGQVQPFPSLRERGQNSAQAGNVCAGPSRLSPCVHIHVKLKTNPDISILIAIKFQDLQQRNVNWLKAECTRRFNSFGLIQQQPVLFLTTAENNSILWDEDSLESVTRMNDMNLIALLELPNVTAL